MGEIDVTISPIQIIRSVVEMFATNLHVNIPQCNVIMGHVCSAVDDQIEKGGQATRDSHKR